MKYKSVLAFLRAEFENVDKIEIVEADDHYNVTLTQYKFDCDEITELRLSIDYFATTFTTRTIEDSIED